MVVDAGEGDTSEDEEESKEEEDSPGPEYTALFHFLFHRSVSMGAEMLQCLGLIVVKNNKSTCSWLYGLKFLD